MDSTFDLGLEHGLSEWCLCVLELVVDDEATVSANVEVIVTHTDTTNLVLKIGDIHNVCTAQPKIFQWLHILQVLAKFCLKAIKISMVELPAMPCILKFHFLQFMNP